MQVMLILSEPTELEKQKRVEQDLFQVFTEFDTDRSGTIDITELKSAMERMGKQVSTTPSAGPYVVCACQHTVIKRVHGQLLSII